MSRFDARCEVIKGYWRDVYGPGCCYEFCMTVSMLLLACLYVLGMTWMVPASVVRCFRKEKAA